MRSRRLHKLLLAILFLLLNLPSITWASDKGISGVLINGYRVLDMEDSITPLSFTVYRGDYIKFKLPAGLGETAVTFPPDKKATALSHDINTAPYFKMKKTGKQAFKIGTINGLIHVIEYEQAHYKAVSAKKAYDFIHSDSPVILDVRTPREYQSGHLENAVLIPVQVLKKHIKDLVPFKNRPILIYCATGNRSTVASKILIDEGFTHITNMRYGIKEWYKNKFKVIR